MAATTATTASTRDRLIVALAAADAAGRAGRNAAALVAFDEPMAVFEWLGAGKALVVLDHAGIPEGELGAYLDRVLGAHEKGLLFIAVVGGGTAVDEAMRAADARARNRDHIGLYHVDETGRTCRVAGRRLPELEKAGGALPEVAPLSQGDVEAIVERGRRERLETVEFLRRNSYRFPQATFAIIALCFLLFAATAANDERGRWLFDRLCNCPAGIRSGEVWRLLTYALLHDTRNLTHLIVNMVSLYSLGSFLEPLLGRRRLVSMFVLSALAGGVASALFTRAISVGASGAVWGLMGATFGLLAGRQRVFPALIARSLRQRLLVILALNVAVSFLPGIDRYCHFGGGIAGYLLALHFARRPAERA
ncbi:MAG: rhomboid family intramembrane serine protease [Deltaproteobacteria bacterium]|nr:rhomboid family intramembrane serine protease [Deltaproteobacteria bacterium]